MSISAASASFSPMKANQMVYYPTYTMPVYNPVPARQQVYTVTSPSWNSSDSKNDDELIYLKDKAFDNLTKGNNDLAIYYLEKSVNVYGVDNRNSVNSLLLLGRLYRGNKQYDKALQKLEQAEKANQIPNIIDYMPSVQAGIETGKTYYEMGDLTRARNFFQSQKGFIQMDIYTSKLHNEPNLEAIRDLNTVNAYLNAINKVLPEQNKQ